ncbi:cyclin-domain-containing protein [Pisolithus thermaeus]|nr:cyclin-domain-containing protein [Pisolithus croceorrhizus]KAI6166091.1 cyclin-domain-containing protein [Pisolithus thermaeus]
MDSSGRVVLPSAFEDADIDILALLIADMLERLMVHNDQIPLLPESLTRFHSRAIPSINVLDYLRRIIKFTKVEKLCLLLTLHYVDQICARTPLFTLSSLTCHRFIIASIAVCSKGLCDTFCTNSFYARVGGIPVSELNDLEREFLRMIDWRLTCTREVLQEYYVNLVRTDSTGRFYIHGMSPSPLVTNATPSPGTTIVPSDFSPTLPVEDSDMESMATSRSPSPTVSSPPQHRLIPREASTILIDTATLTPQAPQGPTVEQNMAFADLQKSWGGVENGPQPDRFGDQIT